MDELKIVMYWSHGGEGQTTTPDGSTYQSKGGVVESGVDRDGNEHPVKEEHTAFLQENGWTFSGDGQNQPELTASAGFTAPVAGVTEEPATDTAVAETAPDGPASPNEPVPDATTGTADVPAPTPTPIATEPTTTTTPDTSPTVETAAPGTDATNAGSVAPDAPDVEAQHTVGSLSSASETVDPSTSNPADMSTQASNVPASEAPASAAEETPNA